MKFLDDKWMAFYENTLRDQFSSEHTSTKASAKVLEIYRDVPEGGDIWLTIDWEEGILASFEHGTNADKVPRDADFRLEAEYKTWVRILSMKEDMTEDLMQGKLSFHGNLAKFQPVLKPFVGAVLMQGLVRPNGQVILSRPLVKASSIVMNQI